MNNTPTENNSAAWAIAAETLFLLNLLLLPGLAFLLLVICWWLMKDRLNRLALNHFRQTLSASLWAGFLLIITNALILLLGGYEGAWIWVIVILYFTLVHSVLILFGAFGLSKALADQHWRFPFFGRPLLEARGP